KWATQEFLIGSERRPAVVLYFRDDKRSHNNLRWSRPGRILRPPVRWWRARPRPVVNHPGMQELLAVRLRKHRHAAPQAPIHRYKKLLGAPFAVPAHSIGWQAVGHLELLVEELGARSPRAEPSFCETQQQPLVAAKRGASAHPELRRKRACGTIDKNLKRGPRIPPNSFLRLHGPEAKQIEVSQARILHQY